MLYGKKDQLDRALKPEARKVINAFLASVHEKMDLGEISLIGEEVFAKIMRYDTTENNNDMVEAHNQYVDIQFLISGSELIKVYDRELLEIKKDYSAVTDCEFFNPAVGARLCNLTLNPGYFAVLFPQDAHLAALNPVDEPVSVHKIVIKIHEEYFA